MKYKQQLYTPTLYFFRIPMKKLKIWYKYRYDPVPYIHKYTNRVRSYYRHVRTTQELRWYYAHKKYIRSKRSPKNLVNTWDDVYISDNYTRSWKRTKKSKQWM